MMAFITLICLAVMVSVAGFVWFWKWNFSPKPSVKVTNAAKARMRYTNSKMNTSEANSAPIRERFANRFKTLPIIGLSKQREFELNRLADVIDWGPNSNVQGIDIYFRQLMRVVPFLLACAVLCLITKYAVFLLFLTPVIYNSPVNKLKAIIANDLLEINFQFPDFYDAVYVQYKEGENNVLLSEIVASYIPVASTSFKRMLKRLMLDLEGGEDQALMKLDERYIGNANIHKFCSVMRQRLKGDEASIVAMTHFREELQTEVCDWMMADLNHRKAIADKITVFMIMAILSVVMVVYFALFIPMAIK